MLVLRFCLIIKNGPGAVPCVNAEFCGDACYDRDRMQFPTCVGCRLNGIAEPLEFRDCALGDVCVVCLGVGRQVKFPAKGGCVHWFCVECTHQLVSYDSTRYELDPTTFGCPPCPRGCDNPVQGMQCMCEGYDEVKDVWRAEHCEEFEAWCVLIILLKKQGECLFWCVDGYRVVP